MLMINNGNLCLRRSIPDSTFSSTSSRTTTLLSPQIANFPSVNLIVLFYLANEGLVLVGILGGDCIGVGCFVEFVALRGDQTEILFVWNIFCRLIA